LKASQRPVVIITSNRESQLPDPFLRRCVFHNIEFPSPVLLKRILQERLGHLSLTDGILDAIVKRFSAMREVEGLQKKPATSELITWARVLYSAQVEPARLEGPLADTPYIGTLLKVREDMDRVGRRPR
jgi:MoxR-like ATPase